MGPAFNITLKEMNELSEKLLNQGCIVSFNCKLNKIYK